MGNQGKMERNSKVCKEVQTMKSIHDKLCNFLKQKICAQRCIRINFENGYYRNYFIKKNFCHTFPVIPQAQNYRESMEPKKAIFRNSKKTDTKSSSTQL